MWVYLGHKMIFILRDGTTLRGRLACSWMWGHWALRDVELLPDDGTPPQELLGKSLIPRTSVTFLQVL